MSAIAERPQASRAGAAGDALVLRGYQRCEWYELALMRHGFTIERLQKLARKVANDRLREMGAVLDDRIDDLLSRLVLVGLQAAIRYDPARQNVGYGSNGGDPFASYVADLMERRVGDFFRSKSEGFGDRRYGLDNRVVLSDMTGSDYVGWKLKEQAIDEYETHPDFERMISERRLARYQQAADATGWSLEEFIMSALDIAADDVLRAA